MVPVIRLISGGGQRTGETEMAVNPVLPPSEEQKKSIFDSINLNEEQLGKDVKSLKEWMRLQPHLPQDVLDDTMLSTFIVGCKNSIEVAKQKIDMYLTNRTSFPELYDNRDPKSQSILQSAQLFQLLTLPSMTPDCCRVTLVRYIDCDASKYDFVAAIKRTLMLADVRIMSDYCQGGEYIVYDMKGLTMMHYVKFTPPLLKKFVYCLQDSAPVRLRGLVFFNAPGFTEMLINLIKPMLKEKNAKRIYATASDHTFLYKFMPKEILPQEYGGEAGTMEQLFHASTLYTESKRDWFLKDASRKVDESLRPEKSVFRPKLLFGVEGSFKKLSID